MALFGNLWSTSLHETVVLKIGTTLISKPTSATHTCSHPSRRRESLPFAAGHWSWNVYQIVFDNDIKMWTSWWWNVTYVHYENRKSLECIAGNHADAACPKQEKCPFARSLSLDSFEEVKIANQRILTTPVCLKCFYFAIWTEHKNQRKKEPFLASARSKRIDVAWNGTHVMCIYLADHKSVTYDQVLLLIMKGKQSVEMPLVASSANVSTDSVATPSSMDSTWVKFHMQALWMLFSAQLPCSFEVSPFPHWQDKVLPLFRSALSDVWTGHLFLCVRLNCSGSLPKPIG